MKPILILLLFVSLVVGTNFDPNTLRLLDYRYDPSHPTSDRINVLFRMNNPLINGAFVDPAVIVKAMNQAALREATLLLPESTPYMVDISLLRPDDPNLQVEKDYFNAHPQAGELRSRTIQGTNHMPSSYSESYIEEHSKDLSWISDDLPGLVEELKNTLNDFSGTQNRYIFVHCQHGHDRAGEVSGAYWISERHRTWEQVSASNWEIADYKHITFVNQNALTWYCHHLQLHRNYTYLTCTHENLDRDSVQTPILIGWDLDTQPLVVYEANEPVQVDEPKSDLWIVILFPTLVGIQGVFLCAICIAFVVLGVKYRNSRKQRSLEERESNLKDVQINFSDSSLESETAEP